MVFRADIIASARTPESRRTPSELYAAKGILKSSPKRRSLWQVGDRPVQDRYRGAGIGSVLWSSHRSAARGRVGIYSTAPRCICTGGRFVCALRSADLM